MGTPPPPAGARLHLPSSHTSGIGHDQELDPQVLDALLQLHPTTLALPQSQAHTLDLWPLKACVCVCLHDVACAKRCQIPSMARRPDRQMLPAAEPQIYTTSQKHSSWSLNAPQLDADLTPSRHSRSLTPMCLPAAAPASAAAYNPYSTPSAYGQPAYDPYAAYGASAARDPYAAYAASYSQGQDYSAYAVRLFGSLPLFGRECEDWLCKRGRPTCLLEP